ncbi:MAG: hypothetical protein IKG23_07705 [Clostridia bacterium]|nr:hypothetical protein [Clostridia bacterium]
MDRNQKLKWLQPALTCLTAVMLIVSRFTEGTVSSVTLVLGVVALAVNIPVIFMLIGGMKDRVNGSRRK